MSGGTFDATGTPVGWFSADLPDGALFDRDLGSAGVARPDKSPAYARMLSALLPPGKVWRLVNGTLSDLLLGCAAELSRLDGRISDLLDEADPTTVLELLPEYESELALASTGTNAERQARIVARTIARQRFRPVDFQTALASLLGQLPANVVVIETTHAAAVAIGDVREIYRFFVYRDPTLPGTYYVASAQALVDAIKPSHTLGFVIESNSALYDDPFSLYDRDRLGA
jgi:uncharacterized protein YmfQ (DUF2313 family)